MFLPRTIDGPRLLPARADLEVRHLAGKGRAVFARRAYALGEVIEVAPVLLLHRANKASYEQLGLDQYLFEWGDDDSTDDDCHFALCLGAASLLNHGVPPNTDWTCDHAHQVIELVATAPIAVGDELTLDYGDVWFPLHA